MQTLAWALAPTWLMDRCARRLGDAFTLTFSPSGMKLVLVSDPEAVKTVFTAPPEVAPSAAGNSPVRPVMGPSSVLVLTGPSTCASASCCCRRSTASGCASTSRRSWRRRAQDMASWPLGEPMRLQERTRAITLEVILRAVFGVEAERMGALRDGDRAGCSRRCTRWRSAGSRCARPSLERPTGAIGRALDRLDAVIYEEIARRRAQQDLAERTDILSLLMQARDEDGEAMTDGELRDELVTLLLAGHETTATSVAWAIERLVRHPSKLARLVAEIDAGAETAASYMTAVVNETLRVRPVVPIVARMLQQELERRRLRAAGGHARDAVDLPDEPQPARVRATRTSSAPSASSSSAPETFSWIPFGGGIRRCIGASFAQLEMKLMLRTVLSELEPSLPAGRGARPGARRAARGELNRRRAITLVPSRGARVVARRWRAAALPSARVQAAMRRSRSEG